MTIPFLSQLQCFSADIIVAGVAVFADPAGTAEIIGEDNWILVSVINAITFSAGIYIVLAGVRMLIAEIIPAFKGISEKLVLNAMVAWISSPSCSRMHRMPY